MSVVFSLFFVVNPVKDSIEVAEIFDGESVIIAENLFVIVMAAQEEGQFVLPSRVVVALRISYE